MTHLCSISDANRKSPCSDELHGLKIDRKTGPVQAPAPEKDVSILLCYALIIHNKMRVCQLDSMMVPSPKFIGGFPIPASALSKSLHASGKHRFVRISFNVFS